MGLFDGYHDPDQFEASGGLLGRLLSLQGMPPDIESGASSPALQAPIPTLMMPAPGTQWPTPNQQTPSAAMRAAFGDYHPDRAPVGLQFGQAATMQPPGNGPSSGDADMAGSAGRFQPVVSDASPDPIRPGSQYAQAPMALCAAGPAGCVVGGGLTAAQMLLGTAALGGLGTLILNNENAKRPPAGSRPINETPWSGDHGEIKGAIGSGGDDKVNISPTGQVWAQNPDGSWTNYGDVGNFTGSGKPKGRRGKDRMDELDDQDEVDERVRQSLRYSVRLLIKHPNIDPAKITGRLGIEPKMMRVAGAPRRDPKGGPLPGVYRDSAWSHWFRVERNRLFFQDVVKVTDRLEPHKEFLREIVNGGGRIALIVHLPGVINIGDHFSWHDMGRLSDLRIELGVEVFPDFN